MAGSTKILTVSYGTFSCTLEGFDDSFHSMKAIAEYFRDLAHEDRYFGAEPPAPDAEMLAKIAEREISRRVEAKMDGKGIRLRATMAEDDAAEKPAAENSVAMPPKAEAPKNSDSPSSLMPAAPLMASRETPEADDDATSVVDEITTPVTPQHPDAESVAAKLQRIRAVVGKPAAPVEETYEDATATDDVAATSEPEVSVTAEDIMADTTDETSAAAELVNEPEIDAPEIEAVEAEIEPEAEAEAVNPTDTNEVAAEADEDVSSDLNDIDEPEEATKAEPVQPAKPIVRARIVRLRKDKPAEVVAAEPSETDDSGVAKRVAAALKSVTSKVAPTVEDTAEAPVEDVVAEDTITDVTVADVVAEDIIADVAEEPAADIEVVEDEVAKQTSTHDDIRAAIAAAIPAGNLSDDDEDDLLRELAAVAEDVVSIEDDEPEVAEIIVEDVAEAPIEMPDVAQAPVEMPEVVEAPARAGREMLPATDDAAMSRIMTQTDEALSEPTGSRRRNAIAQLKAAVAATEAARQLGDQSGGDAMKQEPFREDLDQVVRPRRAVAPDDQNIRSERPRAAPLKLVASQRVDEDDAATGPDVQPRRVAAQAVEMPEVGGFAQFAAQMGATELPDLLEAAAAYTSFVEGVEDFSRPQIMKKVQLTTDEEFSREDGLRSFGTLLRQGRISKVRNGRFQVSEQTRFRPDARSA
ncbi:hypothetical protein FHS72_002347 [Loktanella ponticola]|uniref:Chemotaxis protein CheA n=1 Tax=Yoonia ponticola TaxID=1524255 RepID=A0A7W9BLV7_9RHOB|nr:hypothetical protein [Yoonia ponticola]MBB5722717.1 hypothetical protein [Yoonia ponticola]